GQKERAWGGPTRAAPGAYQWCGGASCGCPSPANHEAGSLKGVFEGLPPVGKDAPERPPLPAETIGKDASERLPLPSDTIGKDNGIDAKPAHAVLDDKAAPATLGPATPANTPTEEAPVRTLPLPPPAERDDRPAGDSPVPPLPPIPPPNDSRSDKQ